MPAWLKKQAMRNAIVTAVCCAMVATVFLIGLTGTIDNSARMLNRPSKKSLILRHGRESTHDIMVGIRLTDYMGYTTFTASTIKDFHRIDSKDIYLFTRYGYGYKDRWLGEWYGEMVKIRTLTSSNMAVKSMLVAFIHSNYKVLFLLDSHVLFSPHWRDYVTKHMIKGNLSFLSLYHSVTMHKVNRDCQEYIGDLCVGDLPSQLGVVLSKELARSILLRHGLLLEKCNWKEILYKENVPSLYPRNSLLMHIGQQNLDGSLCGEYDAPYQFHLSDLPGWIREGIKLYSDHHTNAQEIFRP